VDMNLKRNVLEVAKVSIRLISLVTAALKYRLSFGIFLCENVTEKLFFGRFPARLSGVKQPFYMQPHRVPVELRLTAKLFIDSLYIVEQVRSGIKEASLIFHSHLITQTQWTLDGDTYIAKISIVEDFRFVAVFEASVKFHYLCYLVGFTIFFSFADLAALISQVTTHRDIEFTNIKELDLSFPGLFFMVGNYPYICSYACVIEHLFWQGYDTL